MHHEQGSIQWQLDSAEGAVKNIGLGPASRSMGGPVVLASGVSGVVSCHVKRVKPTDTSDEDIAARKPEVGRLYNDLQASRCRSAR